MEHPLLTYIEDPYAEDDWPGLKRFHLMMQERCPDLQIGLKSVFADSSLAKV